MQQGASNNPGFPVPGMGGEQPTTASHSTKKKGKMPKVNVPGKGLKPGPVILGIGVVSLLAISSATLFFTINPPYLESLNQTQRLVDQVSELADINVLETPTVNIIQDARALRQENAIQAEVYEGAKEGDIVLGFSDKMVIFDPNSERVLYEGQYPAEIAQEQARSLSERVIAKAKERSFIPEDYNTDEENPQTPSLSLINDPEAQREEDPNFYADAQEGDILAVFQDQEVIVIYRPDTDTIVKSGDYDTVITERN